MGEALIVVGGLGVDNGEGRGQVGCRYGIRGLKGGGGKWPWPWLEAATTAMVQQLKAAVI